MFRINKILLVMIGMRVLSSMIELTAAFLMYYFGQVKIAIRINAVLGIIGPLILIFVTFLGLVEISQDISLYKIILIAVGVLFILIGSS